MTEIEDMDLHDCIDPYVRIAARNLEGGLNGDDNLLQKILPALQIHVLKEDRKPFLYCGLESASACFFGQDFARNATGVDTVPDGNHEREMSRDYHQIFETNAVAMQHVRTDVYESEKLYTCFYYRMVFPVRFQSLDAIGVLSRLSVKPILLS